MDDVPVRPLADDDEDALDELLDDLADAGLLGSHDGGLDPLDPMDR